MEKFNPKEELKLYLNKYRLEPRGYYYLEDYANHLLFLIEKCRCNGDDLYFTWLNLKDFIDDDLEELCKVNRNSKNYRIKLNSASYKLNDIKNDFFNCIVNKY